MNKLINIHVYILHMYIHLHAFTNIYRHKNIHTNIHA